MNKLFFAACLSIITPIAWAAQQIKINGAVLRNNKITHGATYIIEDNRTNMIYQDTQTYIEAEIVEVTQTHLVLRCFISSVDASRLLIMRGMPRVEIPLSNGLGMSSLNCDGKEEHFTLILSASC